eukprot:6918110-Lingulodinium_polyedra.AAC.1
MPWRRVARAKRSFARGSDVARERATVCAVASKARARPPRRRSWRCGANRTHGVFSRADETSPRAGATLVAWPRQVRARP